MMRSAEKPSGGGGRGGLRTTGGVNIFEFVPLATQIQGALLGPPGPAAAMIGPS